MTSALPALVLVLEARVAVVLVAPPRGQPR